MHAKPLQTQAKSSISIRSINPQFQATKSRYWFDGNPFITHMVHALSFLFPPGEQMFVNSVNYYKDQIQDPQLKRAVKAFAGQEHLHSASHQQFNDWIASQVPAAEQYCAALTEGINRNYERLEKKKPIFNLAVTVALEHLTAIMAATFLRREDILDKVDPQVRSLLIWHAIEEIEHKNVAFDVYLAVGGSYRDRVLALLISTVVLFFKTFYYQTQLLIQDGQWRNGRAAWSAIKQLFGSQGFFTEASRSYLQYFKPSFHPSQHQDQELVERWQRKLADLTSVRVLGRVELDAAR